MSRTMRVPLIADTNQAYFVQMTTRWVQEGVVGSEEKSPLQLDYDECTYKSWS